MRLVPFCSAIVFFGTLLLPLHAAIDPAFAPEPSVVQAGIRGLASFDDGVAVGLNAAPYVVRLDQSGKRQEGFEVVPPLTERPEILRALPDGGLLVSTRNRLLRLEPDGRVDPDFEDPIGSWPSLWDVQIAGGSIWLAGSFEDPRTRKQTGVLRLLESGAIDPTFQSAETSLVIRILPVPDQEAVYVGGNLGRDPEAPWGRRLRRLHWDGSPDADFGPAADDQGYLLTHSVGGGLFIGALDAMAVAVDAAGRLWIAAPLAFGDTITGMTVITPDGQVEAAEWQRFSHLPIEQMIILDGEDPNGLVRMHVLGRFQAINGRARPLAAALTWQQTAGVWQPVLDSTIDLRPALDTALVPQLEELTGRPGSVEDTYLAVRVGAATKLLRLAPHAGPPEPPVGLAVGAADAAAIRFTWERAAFADTVFLERRVGETWATVSEADLARRYAVATGLASGQTDTFRIRAINAHGEAASDELTASTTASTFPGALDVSFLPDLNALRFGQEGQIVDHQVLTANLIALATDRAVGLFDATGAWLRTIAFIPTSPEICCLDRDAKGRLLIAGNELGYGDSVRRYLPDGTKDSSFRPEPFVGNTFISALAVHGEGILVGGIFENGTRPSLRRLLEDGTVDESFLPPPADEVYDVSAISVGPEGTFFIAGRLNQWQGQTHRGLAKVLSDGRLDPAFQPGHSDTKRFLTVSALLALEDGGALVVGDYQDGEQNVRKDLLKIRPDGSLDPDFYRNQNLGGDVQSLLAIPEGGWLVGGHFLEIQGIARARLALLESDGRVATDINPGLGLNYFVESLDTLSFFGEDQVLVSGIFEGYQDVPQPGAARIHLAVGEAGGPPTLPASVSVVQIGATTFRVEWSPATNHEGYRLETRVVGREWELAAVVEPEARFVVLSGYPERRDLEFRLHAFAGEVTTRWSEPIREETSEALRPAQGLKATVSGVDVSLSWYQIPGASGMRVERRPGGGDGDWFVLIAPSFTVYTDRGLEPGAVYDYRVVATNDFGEEASSDAVTVRIGEGLERKDGTLDPRFKMGSPPELVGSIMGLALFRDRSSSVVLSGHLSRRQENLGPLIEVNMTGAVLGELPLPPDTLAAPERFFPSADGKVYLAGRHYLDHREFHRLIRLLPSGEMDPDFEILTVDTAAAIGRWGIQTVVPLPSGKLLVAGDFDGASGHRSHGVLRLEADGQVDPAFAVAADLQGIVYAVAPLPGGAVMAAGEFVFNHPNRRIFQVVRLTSSGALDLSFDPTFINGTVYALHVLADGKVYVAGNFAAGGFNIDEYRLMARLESNGAIDPGFRLPRHPDVLAIYAMFVEPGGKVLAAGDRLPLDGGRLASLARYEADGTVDETFVPSLVFPDGVRTLQISDGFLYATGFFDSIDSVAHHHVARFYYEGREGIGVAAWLARQGISEAIDLTLDLDEDGLPLWQEYLYDLSVLERDAWPKPLWRQGERAEVNFQLRQGSTEVEVEASGDLQVWQRVEGDVEANWIPVPDGAAYLRLRWAPR